MVIILAIAIFANKTFEVNANKLYTFDGFQYASSLQTEKQDSTNGKPNTYIKGPDLDNVSFTIKLDVAFGIDPRREWEDWRAIMNSQITYPFILGGRPLSPYNFLLLGVTPSNVNFDNKGNILAMDLELKFDEFVHKGAAASTGTSTGTSKSKASSKGLTGLSSNDMASLIM
jgi:hypothetical protein